MKILYKNMGFGGGAPKSLLQYVKVAKKRKHEVVVVGKHTYNPKEYKENNIRLIDFPYFEINKPFKSFYLLIKYLEIIKNERPDIIHTTTQENCYFHTVISKVNKIPIIYNIPGGKVSKFTAEVMENEELLVYSEENKFELIKYGYDPNKITIISNRIDTSQSNNEYAYHYNTLVNKNSEIRFLLTSRMSDAHLNSIKYIIHMVEKLNVEKFNIKLDVLGEGQHFSTVKSIATKANQYFKKDIILVHGFKENVSDYIQKSHFVFGKGRSVLDGIVNSRISFVVSENDTFCHCNLKSFENLRTYNFAGRNLEFTISYEELVEYITNVYKNKLELNYLKDLKGITKEFYDIKLAEVKIMKLYKEKNLTMINYKPNILTVLKEYVSLYIKMFRIKRKIKKSNSTI